MAHLSEILEREKQRTNDAECRVIHLFPEGTFYRAYQWSAWLCSRYISQFKPTRRQIKNTEDYLVFIGFPTASLTKFVPEGVQPIVNEDKTVDIRIPESLVPAIESAEPFLPTFLRYFVTFCLLPKPRHLLSFFFRPFVAQQWNKKGSGNARLRDAYRLTKEKQARSLCELVATEN